MISAPLKRYLLAFIAVVNLLVLFYYGLGAWDLIKLIATLLVGTLIPGLLVLHFFKLYPNTFYRFILAFIIGISLDILIFIFFSLLTLRFLIYVLLAITLIVYLVKDLHKRDWRLMTSSIRAFPDNYGAFLSLASLLILGLIVVFFYIPNQLPGAQAVVYYVDYPWHLGNIAEILHHWAPQDPRLAGLEFNYHIFFYVYMAFLAFVSKVSLPLLYFRFYILFFLYLLMGGAYFLASRWFQSREAGIVHIIIVFFLGTALLSWPHNVFLRNFFISPTFLFALLILFPLLSEISACLAKAHRGRLVVTMLLVFAVSGAKGSFFPVIGAALLFTVFYAWIYHRPLFPSLLMSVSGLAVFGVVFMLIFKGPGGEGINIMPFEIVNATALYHYFQSSLPEMNQSWFAVIILTVYLILFYSFRLPALLNEIVNTIRLRRDIELKRVFLLAMILAGCIPAYFLSYRGTSQYYFLFVGWAGLNLLATGYLLKIFKSKRHLLMKILLLMLILLSASDTVLTMQYQDYSNKKHQSLRNKPVTPDIFQGLEFLRQESQPDAVIASYRSFWLNKDNPRFFYYSAFAERRILVEGWMYMRPQYQEHALARYADMQTLFYTRNTDLARDILERYGIDYILVDKGHKQRLRFPWSAFLKKVYSNDEIEIYWFSPSPETAIKVLP